MLFLFLSSGSWPYARIIVIDEKIEFKVYGGSRTKHRLDFFITVNSTEGYCPGLVRMVLRAAKEPWPVLP